MRFGGWGKLSKLATGMRVRRKVERRKGVFLGLKGDDLT